MSKIKKNTPGAVKKENALCPISKQFCYVAQEQSAKTLDNLPPSIVSMSRSEMQRITNLANLCVFSMDKLDKDIHYSDLDYMRKSYSLMKEIRRILNENFCP